jgi:signal transduction histidine kinase
MLTRFKHNTFASVALATALLFGIIELATPLFAGPGRVDMNTPIGQLALHVSALFSPAPSLLRAGTDRDALALQLVLGATALLLALFIWLLWLRVRPDAKRSWTRSDGLIVAQLVIAWLLGSILHDLIVAAQLAVLMPLRRGLAWLAVGIVLGLAADLYLIVTTVRNDGLAMNILLSVSLERVVQVLAFGIACIVGHERRTRLALGAAHAELLATQSLLGQMVRSSERMRIARDLHDVVGHHLTALNLHLELALRQSDGKAATSLQTARTLAHDMLAEVRSIVGSERRDQPIELREALYTLCSGIPEPAITLTIDDGVEIDSPTAAHTLFFCVQEAITNAVRHAHADWLSIHIGYRDGSVCATIADNGRGRGRGSLAGAEGNGLRGMRERLAQIGGALQAGNLPTRGYGLAICLPRAGALP